MTTNRYYVNGPGFGPVRVYASRVTDKHIYTTFGTFSQDFREWIADERFYLTDSISSSEAR